jgi:DNA polymerase-3 subunit beta
MQLHATAGELAAAAKVAASVVDSAATKRFAILGTLLIEGTGDAVTFTGTDLDLAITTICAGAIKEAGRTACAAEALSRLLAGVATDVEVAVTADTSGLRITAGRARYRLPVLPAEDYPQSPTVATGTELVLSKTQVQRLFGSTAFAISDEKARYYLNGAYLHCDQLGRLCVVATDTHQMALVKSMIEPDPGTLPAAGVIVPQRTVEQILKLKADEIVVRTDGNAIEARAGNITIASKLIAGTYPDFRRIISVEPVATGELDRAALLAALQRMDAANTQRKTWRVMLTWAAGGDAVQLAVAGGEMAVDAIAATVSGEANIMLAVDRLLTLVDAIHAKRLTLGVVSADEPLRIRPADDGDLLTVLAPCH